MELEDRVHLTLFSHCTISEKTTTKRQALKSDWLIKVINLSNHNGWQTTAFFRPVVLN